MTSELRSFSWDLRRQPVKVHGLSPGVDAPRNPATHLEENTEIARDRGTIYLVIGGLHQLCTWASHRVVDDFASRLAGYWRI
jgi:hypothetical protein